MTLKGVAIWWMIMVFWKNESRLHDHQKISAWLLESWGNFVLLWNIPPACTEFQQTSGRSSSVHKNSTQPSILHWMVKSAFRLRVAKLGTVDGGILPWLCQKVKGKGAQVHGAHQAASHVPALYLPSCSRYSFTDPKRMEGSVSPGPGQHCTDGWSRILNLNWN